MNVKGFDDYLYFVGEPQLERTTKLTLWICFMDSEDPKGHDYIKAMSALRCAFRDELQPTNIFDDPILSYSREKVSETFGTNLKC